MNESESVSTLSPQLLARAYDRFVSARWRGEDEAADPVALWFEAHWVSEPSPEPETPPAGASVLGASGRGIHWYARGDQLLGYVPGHDEGCYRVAAGETMPALTSPWDASPSPRLASDRILHLIGNASSESHATAGWNDKFNRAYEAQIEPDRVLSQTPVAGLPGASANR
jgi:hypothetical protein